MINNNKYDYEHFINVYKNKSLDLDLIADIFLKVKNNLAIHRNEVRFLVLLSDGWRRPTFEQFVNSYNIRVL